MKSQLKVSPIVVLTLLGCCSLSVSCVQGSRVAGHSKHSQLATITTGVRNAETSAMLSSHFECRDLGNGRYRPYYLQAIEGASELKNYSQTPKGLLGQNPMKSLDECQQALNNANHQFGVICSRTGLDGWKPTLYTGTVPGRADFGYLGGSSIMNFQDCL